MRNVHIHRQSLNLSKKHENFFENNIKKTRPCVYFDYLPSETPSSSAFFCFSVNDQLFYKFFDDMISNISLPATCLALAILPSMEDAYKTISVTCSDGSIHLITIADNDVSFSLIGQCEHQLVAAAWNNTRTRLLLVERVKESCVSSTPVNLFTVSLLDEFMNPVWQGLELTLVPNELSTASSLGWGKKETQYHGPGQRDKAQQIQEIDDCLVNGDDETMVGIAWNTDERHAAITSIINSTRKVTIIDIDRGNILSQSERTIGLTGASLAWHGHTVAAHQQIMEKNQVCTQRIIFFERNGLIHGEPIELPPFPQPVISLFYWGSLLVVLQGDWEQATSTRMLIFRKSNYKWYLGHVIEHQGHENGLFGMGLPLSGLNIPLTAGGQPVEYGYPYDLPLLHISKSMPSFLWSRTKIDRAGSLVAVIDGSKLLLTDFNQGAPPPPLSHFQLNLAESSNLEGCFINEIVRFSKNISESCANLVLITSFNQVLDVFIDLEKWQVKISQSIEHQCCDAQLTDSPPFREQHLTLDLKLSMEGKLCTGYSTLVSNGTSFLALEHWLFTTCSDNQLRVFVKEQVTEQEDNLLANYKLIDTRLLADQGALLVTACQEDTCLVLQMPRGNLELIFPRVLTEAYLGKILEETKAKDLASKSFAKAYAHARRHRLDLALIVDCYFSALLSKNFNSESNASVTDMDLLRPSQLGSKCGSSSIKDFPAAEFVKQVPKAEYLNLFLMSLVERLKSPYHAAHSLLYRSVIESIRACTMHLPTVQITSHVIMPEAGINAALMQIIDIVSKGKNEAIHSENAPQRENLFIDENEEEENVVAQVASAQYPSMLRSEEALKHLMFLVADHQKLFDHALGLYNLPLALSIARRSHVMNPAVYDPLLLKLYSFHQQEADDTLFKHEIDKHLGRHELAVKWLVFHVIQSSHCENGQDISVVEYCKFHECHKATIGALNERAGKTNSLYTPVLLHWAQTLESSSSQSNSPSLLLSAICAIHMAIAYENNSSTTALVHLYQFCLRHPSFWSHVLAHQIKDESYPMTLFDTLTRQGLHEDAFSMISLLALRMDSVDHQHRIMLQNTAMQGFMWPQLMCLPTIRAEQLYTTIKEQMKQAHVTLESLFLGAYSANQAFLARLDAFSKRITTLAAAGEESLDLIPDDLSMTTISKGSSILQSIISGATTPSRKSKRKAERDREKGKPGSKHYRETLHRDLVKTVFDLIGKLIDRDVIRGLVPMLLAHGNLEYARQAYQEAMVLTQYCQNEVKEYNRANKVLNMLVNKRIVAQPIPGLLEKTFLTDVVLDLPLDETRAQALLPPTIEPLEV